MSTDKEGFLSELRKWPHWSFLWTCIGVFFLGYIYGEHRTQRNWEAELKKMVETDIIKIGYGIKLNLTEEKRNEILDAMQDAIEQREEEDRVERQAAGR